MAVLDKMSRTVSYSPHKLEQTTEQFSCVKNGRFSPRFDLAVFFE